MTTAQRSLLDTSPLYTIINMVSIVINVDWVYNSDILIGQTC